ncbi:MAG: hypothetical protein JWP02_807 [Acidimicrobiales bacterium]|nr:hypothetical protein [Acidimicrobiales bacterium]
MATTGVAAELSSITTALEELAARITGLAERETGSEEEAVVQALFGVERTLGEALRRLERLEKTMSQ